MTKKATDLYSDVVICCFDLLKVITLRLKEATAIAPWFRLQLPSCDPGFKSQAYHQLFYQFCIIQTVIDIGLNEKEAENGPYL